MTLDKTFTKDGMEVLKMTRLSEFVSEKIGDVYPEINKETKIVGYNKKDQLTKQEIRQRYEIMSRRIMDEEIMGVLEKQYGKRVQQFINNTLEERQDIEKTKLMNFGIKLDSEIDRVASRLDRIVEEKRSLLFDIEDRIAQQEVVLRQLIDTVNEKTTILQNTIDEANNETTTSKTSIGNSNKTKTTHYNKSTDEQMM